MQFQAHSEMVDGVETLWAESMFRGDPIYLVADTREELMDLAVESARIHESAIPFSGTSQGARSACLIWGLS